MAGKRVSDPDAIVQVATKIPNWLRNKFAAAAFLKGDIQIGKRLERLIRMDVESVFPGETENGSVVDKSEELVNPSISSDTFESLDAEKESVF